MLNNLYKSLFCLINFSSKIKIRYTFFSKYDKLCSILEKLFKIKITFFFLLIIRFEYII